MSACARSAQISSCSSAAARNVSAAARTTECPCSRSLFASLPIVVVLPVPLTPTTQDHARPRRATARRGAAVPLEQRGRLLDERLAEVAERRPRASSRCTSSAVAGTPTSAAISASSSRSQASSSAASKRFERELLGQRAAALAERVAQAPEEARALRLRLLRLLRRLPSSSAHVRAMRRGRLGGRGFALVARRAPRDDLRDARRRPS